MSTATRIDLDSAIEIGVADRALTVSNVLGGRAKLARMLSVTASQPTRWIQGTERPSPANARAILDLDYVIARAGLLWAPPVIQSWLYGHNAFLNGASPIDVIQAEGSGPVVDALDQELAGAFA